FEHEHSSTEILRDNRPRMPATGQRQTTPIGIRCETPAASRRPQRAANRHPDYHAEGESPGHRQVIPVDRRNLLRAAAAAPAVPLLLSSPAQAAPTAPDPRRFAIAVLPD